MLWHAAGARVKGESPPRRPSDTAWESYPGVVLPTHVVRLSPAQCGSCAGRSVSTPRHYAAHSRTASTSHPSKEDGGTLERRTAAYSAPAWDGAVTSGQQGASPPSCLALCGHPRHCAAIPGTAASSPTLWKPGMMGHYHSRRCTSSDPPVSPTLEQAYGWRPNEKLPHHHPRSRSWIDTGLATTLARSKIRQDSR
jgi:hypothetical protein